MAKAQPRYIISAFEERRQAHEAIAELCEAGFREDQIGLAVRQPGGENRELPSDDISPAEAGLSGHWTISIAAGLLPTIGVVVAGGILGSLLAGAAGGAAVGGLLRALDGMGLPEEERDFYEQEFRRGWTIVAVKANGQSNEARAILQQHGGVGVCAPPVERTTRPLGKADTLT